MNPLAIFVLGVAFTTVFGDKTCKSGLPKSASQGSLDGKCYALFTNGNTDYNHADKKCKTFGGLLAMPKTKPINNLLTGTLKSNSISSAWIGLHDRDAENLFKWADGTTLNYHHGFRAFAKGNGPHREFDIKSNIEDCVVLTSNGAWYDYKCEAYKIGFITLAKEDKHYICEFNIPTTTTRKPPTTTPKPATTTPKPATTTPKPATTTPKQATTTPKPATTTPKSATTTPKPATTTPKPTTATPKPATTTPKPATTTPKPATTTPKPATTTPKPATTTPKPATTTPKPATTTPKPATTTPKPATTTPKPATTTPKPATTTPKPATTTPKPATTTPKPATTTPPVVSTGCPSFDCGLDCGFDTFKTDSKGCFKCECESGSK